MTIVVFKIIIAIIFGGLIGFEREYRSKAAGFRTITLITLGCAMFTIVSDKVGNADRIVANILTGIGFIGAGAIFKDGPSVSGLTTAASIWIAAGLGVAVGIGEYFIGAAACVASIVVLAAFEAVQSSIEKFHQVRSYRVVFETESFSTTRSVVEAKEREFGVKTRTKKFTRIPSGVLMQCNMSGDQTQLDQFSTYLLTAPGIKSFDE